MRPAGVISLSLALRINRRMALLQASSVVLQRVRSSSSCCTSAATATNNFAELLRTTRLRCGSFAASLTTKSPTNSDGNCIRPASTQQVVSAPNDCLAFVDGILGKQCAAELDLEKSYLLFLGTGTSEGIPRVSCLTNQLAKCPVCWSAAQIGNKNRRRNTSVVVRVSTTTGMRNILIDAGKFFYHSALQWFPYYGIRELDAVILTHSHADAMGGLDDLRDWTNNVQDMVPVFLAKRDYEVMTKTHYYLVDTSVVMEGAAVSTLEFRIITKQPFFVHGLKVIPLPVWHGPGYQSLGYRFGNICYISDVSEIPEETYPLLENCDLLIMDALRPDRSSATHFGLPRALEEVRRIRPKRTLFTGMMHTMDHDSINTQLAKLSDSEGLDVQLSYDGLQLPIEI